MAFALACGGCCAAGGASLKDETKRAVLVTMAPDALAAHLKMSSNRLDSCDTMGWGRTNSIALASPREPVRMRIGRVEMWHDEEYDDGVDSVGGAKGKAKKGDGKRKGKRESAGNGEFPGLHGRLDDRYANDSWLHSLHA